MKFTDAKTEAPAESDAELRPDMDDHALRNWAHRRGVTRVQLADAMDAAGPSASRVREYLAKRQQAPSDKAK